MAHHGVPCTFGGSSCRQSRCKALSLFNNTSSVADEMERTPLSSMSTQGSLAAASAARLVIPFMCSPPRWSARPSAAATSMAEIPFRLSSHGSGRAKQLETPELSSSKPFIRIGPSCLRISRAADSDNERIPPSDRSPVCFPSIRDASSLRVSKPSRANLGPRCCESKTSVAGATSRQPPRLKGPLCNARSAASQGDKCRRPSSCRLARVLAKIAAAPGSICSKVERSADAFAVHSDAMSQVNTERILCRIALWDSRATDQCSGVAAHHP